jgi:predicted ester cyclase
LPSSLRLPTPKAQGSIFVHCERPIPISTSVDTQIAEGDLVATCVVARGTHRGEFWRIEPTNKPIRINAVNIDQIEKL